MRIQYDMWYIYRVSRKKRSFKIIILQADTSERSDSWPLESDLSEVLACRMMILKVRFFVDTLYVSQWQNNQKLKLDDHQHCLWSCEADRPTGSTLVHVLLCSWCHHYLTYIISYIICSAVQLMSSISYLHSSVYYHQCHNYLNNNDYHHSGRHFPTQLSEALSL